MPIFQKTSSFGFVSFCPSIDTKQAFCARSIFCSLSLPIKNWHASAKTKKLSAKFLALSSLFVILAFIYIEKAPALIAPGALLKCLLFSHILNALPILPKAHV